MEYWKHDPERWVRHYAGAPLIFAVFVPVVLLDLVMELYHRICFPLYGLAYVERSRYIKFDRHKLSYLSWFARFSCTYCAYVNGLLRYAVEIAARSEWYWCGVMHEPTKGFIMPPHQRDFLPYGDEDAFRTRVGLPPKKKTRAKRKRA